jgi:hypothetical protein
MDPTSNELRRQILDDPEANDALVKALVYLGDAVREADGYDTAEAIKSVATELGGLGLAVQDAGRERR